jgi:hypothetical protein
MQPTADVPVSSEAPGRSARIAPAASILAGALILTAAAAILAGAGCGGRASGPADDAEHYGRLPGLRASPHAQLQNEFDRIVEEGGTPEQLAQSNLDDESNVAAGLMELFPEDAEQLRALVDAAGRILPARDFRFDAVRLQKAAEFRAKHRAEWEAFRAALKRPKCDFQIAFLRGPFAEARFIDVVWLCGRLEAMAAAEALADKKVGEALDALGAMLRLAGCLAAEPHPIPRLEGAFLRTEAFPVAQAVVEHESFSRSDLDRLAEIVAAELAAWPDDARAWIGDRAVGMYVYEVVRGGDLTAVLTDEEIAELRGEGTIREAADAARRFVDEDQRFYFDAMRKVIEACDRPYHARLEVFEAVESELDRRRDTLEFPLIAGRLLLKDLRSGHAIQARDRANWEAWACGLAAVQGRKLPYVTSPLSGQPYRVERHDRVVAVRGVGSPRPGDDTPIFIPIPSR